MRTTASIAPHPTLRLPTLLASALLLVITALGAPLAVAESDAPKPQVTSRQQDDRQLREYRVNGHLYAIEIIPKGGTPFFLLDSDGNGNFTRSSVSQASQLKVPGWARKK
ncbi:DUF2782 domain-containing protein [Cobetia marina]|jgi:hypothetical protein|uniref:DUF2782 domain-containing protein n=1 Tax=Cobetia TaxID=204286 RepID=UPI000865975C|nr:MULTISPECIES: DUF2782 domain-containing protein [Cobetia]AOM02505.1 hypothetical protein BFX80_16115 [Cobetia marina]AZV32303.1 DUF2782 domain-containing protein [Cobetia sp. ICG0124]MDH2373473.1 DUF2782 domain-containing protein [Cobetia sp. 3AK]MDI6003067.1 DUF2782 domain-containing protein [Cobetia pacifica]MDN2655507.1 DUF2782 domain-containing protein [Cobetia sp. 14N.309.X.WAT.E.A4]